MKVVSAQYGIPGNYTDVTDTLASRLKNGKLHLTVNNSLAGDPAPGHVKHLSITIEDLNQVKSYKFPENTVCVLPETNCERLGIFYSNNNNQKIYPAITASLKSIEKAARSKADIITCMWNHYPGNPFTELIAWTNTSSHLNQVLQILQCLYTAAEVKNYKYVSFLEHDVLYSEYYFDYPDFDSGILANMNYIGLNRDGWQTRMRDDKPTSQLTMLFGDAIDHFSGLVRNALVRNSGLLEPQIKMEIWNSAAPNVHINHGVHFTSHYSIYSSQTTQVDQYWGLASQYQHLLLV